MSELSLLNGEANHETPVDCRDVDDCATSRTEMIVGQESRGSMEKF